MKKKLWVTVFIIICVLSLSSCFGGTPTTSPQPSPIVLNPPEATKLISYVKSFDIDMLTQETLSFTNGILVKLETSEASSQSEVTISVQSKLQEGKLIASVSSTGKAFDKKGESSFSSYYDGTAAYYSSDKTKVVMSQEDYVKSACIIPYIMDKITADSISNLKSQELNKIVTHYFDLKPEAVDFSPLLGDAQFTFAQSAYASIQMDGDKPAVFTVGGTGKYIKGETQYDAQIAVSVSVKTFADFTLPENLSEYTVK